eukprot:4458969-Pyramimonas_sp.AAC.1
MQYHCGSNGGGLLRHPVAAVPPCVGGPRTMHKLRRSKHHAKRFSQRHVLKASCSRAHQQFPSCLSLIIES